MVEISSDITNGLITISDKFDLLAATGSANSSPSFLQPGDEYSLSFLDLQNVKKLTKFTYDTVGLTDNRYLLTIDPALDPFGSSLAVLFTAITEPKASPAVLGSGRPIAVSFINVSNNLILFIVFFYM